MSAQEAQDQCRQVFTRLFGPWMQREQQAFESFLSDYQDPTAVFFSNPFILVTEYQIPFQIFRHHTGLQDYTHSKILIPTFDMFLQELFACVYSILLQNEKAGNTWMTEEAFFNTLHCFFPLFNNQDFYYYLQHFNRTHSASYQIYQNGGRVAFLLSKQKEDYIKNKITVLRNSTIPTTVDFHHTDNPQLSKEQNAAIRCVMRSDLSILTGGPGTGKTTTIKTILQEYQDQYPDRTVKLLAPTGKAAKRMSECVDSTLCANTIHFLTVKERFHRKHKQLEHFDFFIIDESSMIDLNIFHELWHYIDVDKILLVGDVDQLESVGCGNILADLIDLGVPCARLSQNHRSGDTILNNARKINQQQTALSYDQSFQFVETDSFHLEECVLGYYTPGHTMILHPYRTGVLKLNQQIQQILMPGTDPDRFYPGIRVLFTRNNRERGYVNGDTGTVIRTDTDYMDVELDDGRVLRVNGNAYEDVTLAYAMTIHKSQGSEYDQVIICIPDGCNRHFAKNLLYTAVTRAKQKVVLIGSKQALQQMIKQTPRRRKTFMSLPASA